MLDVSKLVVSPVIEHQMSDIFSPMGLEIEKKYRLTHAQREELLRRLPQTGATLRGEEFEENTLYAGGVLDTERQVLRLRRVGDKALLTFKERFASSAAIKHQREDETRVDNADALHTILCAIGFTPALVYEKRRATWDIAGAEVVVDELSFGLFVEIEAEEKAILEIEKAIGLHDAEAEMASYPELAARHGIKRGGLIEARFQKPLP